MAARFFSLILFFLHFTISTSLSSDTDTLLHFKSSSDPLNSLSSWTISSSACSGNWLGVSCQNGRVARLLLENLNLSGTIETLIKLDQLRVLSLKNNNLTSFSSSSLDFTPWKNMKRLYLSRNEFSGEFPAGIPSLHRLRRLDLAHNRFSSHIPDLGRLPHLLTLRLEQNFFTGNLVSIPVTVSDFNVSGNNLVGEIPKPCSSFPESSFSGNENLCGPPLQSKCSIRPVKSDPIPIAVSGKGHKLSKKVLVTIILTDVAAVSVIIAVFVYCCFWKKKREQKGKLLREKAEKRKNNFVGFRERIEKGEEMVFFEGCEGFKRVEDLLKASAEMLGKGSVGTTYKAVMDGGKVLVVKRVRERKRKEGKEMEVLMNEIGRLRHLHVVSLRAYYASRDEMLLVYDYLPNGSLHSLLHGNRGPGRTPLDWTTRLQLASGAAKGLAFLHETCKSKLPHGHLTCTNILIDHAGNARISDFGLHQLLSPSPPLNNPYRAPELLDNNSRKLSQKSDIYSFGVILLEMLTGKVAGESGMDLVEWVRTTVKDEWTIEIFDLELLSYKEMEEEMIALLQVALLCLASLPKERPKMSMVHKMIEDIRTRGSGGPHSPAANDRSSDSSPALSEDTPTFNST